MPANRTERKPREPDQGAAVQFPGGSDAATVCADVADKFRGCAEFAKWPRQKAEAVIEFVKTLESPPGCGQVDSAADELKTRAGALCRPISASARILAVFDVKINLGGMRRNTCHKKL